MRSPAWPTSNPTVYGYTNHQLTSVGGWRDFPRMCTTSAAMHVTVATASNPITWTSAFGAFELWRRLPPAQRRLVMQAARTHAPKVAAAVPVR